MMADWSDSMVYVLYALGKLVIFALLLERGLFFIFDYSKWREKIEGKGIRAPVSLAFAWIICWWYDFDIWAALFDPDAITPYGIFLTATIVAGGSSGAIVLFQKVLGWNRASLDEIKNLSRISVGNR